MFRSLRARLALAYVALVVAALLLLSWLLNALAQDLYLQNLRARLAADGRLIAEIVRPRLDDAASGQSLDPLAKELAQHAQARVTVIRRDGLVLGDSDEPAVRMGDHSTRPEVIQAIATGRGESIRFSQTIQRDLLYVATAVQRDQEVVAVVRLAVPLQAIEEARARIAGLMLGAGLAISLVAVAIAVVIARRTTESLAHLGRVAARLAAGDLSARARTVEPLEVNRLATSVNRMAAQLSETIQALQGEQARLAAVLAHMADGLLLVDAQDRVLQLNQAAERILGARAEEAAGKSFIEVVRDHEMADGLRQARRTAQETNRLIEQSGPKRFLRMVVTPLSLADSPRTYLVMLQDLTQVRRLETIRRDFISNISHELRTPLAGLRALVETLNDGALEDLPAARGFLAQMDDEIHHLSQLVNDLLDLASVESGSAPLERKRVDLTAVVQRAAERLQPQAARAGVSLSVSRAPPAYAVADGARVEQVILNLMHNAIKFTASGGCVECRVVQDGSHVVVSVQDTGIGIAESDLPRIFERFYKADRSRARGGTGLGLAIARHIVELHGGRIWAESVERQGTTISFTLPLG